MTELKDPAIKLFGKTIPLCPTDKLYTRTPPLLPNEQNPHPDPNIPLLFADPSPPPPDKPCSSEEDDDDEDDDADDKKPTEEEEEDEEPESTTCSYPSDQEATTKPPPSETSSRTYEDDPKTPSPDKEPISPKVSNNNMDHPPSDTQDDNNNNNTTLTKPDKILPCPRCNSMDTKFCYFNNYNVNQPRHFCKNCQRYWTAGGTMRNVPVGSGRRKNKTTSPSSPSPSSAHYHHRHALAIEALQAATGTHYPVLRPNNSGTVIAFGSDAPLCESINSTLNLGDQKSVKHLDDSHQETLVKNFPTLPLTLPLPLPPPHIPYYAGPPPWSMPWRPAATFGPPGFPTLIYPAPPPPFWGCVPIIPATNTIPTEAAISCGPSSPLGKHSREGNIFGSKEGGGGGDAGWKGVLVHPKTLRIDDPNEAAKSSIWSTLGIKNENLDSVIGRGLFKPLNSKTEVEPRTPLAMQANPVALSRSQNFRENAP